jgi:hypothetical protein
VNQFPTVDVINVTYYGNKNMKDNNIIINSRELNEYLPIAQYVLSNGWSCDIEHTTGILQIKRKYSSLPLMLLMIMSLSVFILGCSLLFLKTTSPEYKDIWLMGIFLIPMSFFFMLVFPMLFSYTIAKDKNTWSECRFKCAPNGDIEIFEKICFKRDEYLEVAVGVVGGYNTLGLYTIGGGQKNRSKWKFLLHGSVSYGYQLYIYIKKDFVWKKYLLANEYMSKRKIMSAAKMLSKSLQCKLYIHYVSYTECLDQQEMVDREVLKSISNQPYLYVGEFSYSALVQEL